MSRAEHALVVGGGRWGRALAKALSAEAELVRLWSRSIQDDLIATIAAKMPEVPDKDDPDRRHRLIARLNERSVEQFEDTDLTVRFR